MLTRLSIPTLAALVSLIGPHALAGGPPRLCLPLDGVTAATAGDCGKRLAAALGKRVVTIDVRQNEGQWYAILPLREDLALGDVDQALKGSSFSVPRDKLRLFGHAILEVDLGTKAPEAFLRDLAAIPNLSIEESKREKGHYLVTLDMPYAVFADGRAPEFEKIRFGEPIFGGSDLSADAARRSAAPTAAGALPNYASLRDVLAKHEVKLAGLRWSQRYACRMFGGVIAPPAAETKKGTQVVAGARAAVEAAQAK